MKSHFLHLMTLLLLAGPAMDAGETSIPADIQKIMDQPKYKHAFWGLCVKDLNTGEIIIDLNSEKLFSPASTTKLFSVAALLHAYGDEYCFETPIYADGKIRDGVLKGNLVLVAQGDLTMGGRELNSQTIAYTKLDHINANEIPGVILTPQDPLKGLKTLAKQVAKKGIKEIDGEVLIDDSLFETVVKRGFTISPILINENFIDVVINPGAVGQPANLSWRPIVPGYEVINELQTVAQGEPITVEISSDEIGHRIVVKGKIPLDQHDLVRTFSVKDPKNLALAALIQALDSEGIKIRSDANNSNPIPLPKSYKNIDQVALWTSPPLSEYGKLILKVSHNLGADLVPLLLAAKAGKKTFDEGMTLFGEFVTETVKISPDAFVFVDAAGGNENRLTPQAEIQLLEYVKNEKPEQFKHYFDALPLLGVDGSLEDFAKNSAGAGKVRAKPGTGVAFNLATGKFFLITQALGGYIEAKNGHLYAYMLAVNNGVMPTIEDIFPIFEDVSEISSMIYDQSPAKYGYVLKKLWQRS